MSKLTLISLLFLMIASFLILTGFQEKNTIIDVRQIKVQAEIDKRINAFRNGRLKRCRERILEAAGELVDSIIIVRSQDMIHIDSIQKPPKPQKPDKPIVPALEYTAPIAPFLIPEKTLDILLENSIVIDSITPN